MEASTTLPAKRALCLLGMFFVAGQNSKVMDWNWMIKSRRESGPSLISDWLGQLVSWSGVGAGFRAASGQKQTPDW